MLVSSWFFASLAKRFVTGTWSMEFNIISSACQNFWWKDVLQISNFITKQTNESVIPMVNYTCLLNAASLDCFLVKTGDTIVVMFSCLVVIVRTSVQLRQLSSGLSSVQWFVYLQILLTDYI